MGGTVELLGCLLSGSLISQGLYHESGFLSIRRCLFYEQPTQPIYMILGFARPMMDHKIKLLKGHRSVVEKSRSNPNGFQPLSSVMICVNVKFIQHQVRAQLSCGPHNS